MQGKSQGLWTKCQLCESPSCVLLPLIRCCTLIYRPIVLSSSANQKETAVVTRLAWRHFVLCGWHFYGNCTSCVPIATRESELELLMFPIGTRVTTHLLPHNSNLNLTFKITHTNCNLLSICIIAQSYNFAAALDFPNSSCNNMMCMHFGSVLKLEQVNKQSLDSHWPLAGVPAHSLQFEMSTAP